MKHRAELFRYVGLDVTTDTLTGHYELDGRAFEETVTFDGVGPLTSPNSGTCSLGSPITRRAPHIESTSARPRLVRKDESSSRRRSLTASANSRTAIRSTSMTY